MKYFLHDGEEKQGPFSLDELKTKNISKKASVWREGLEDWTEAGSLEELSSLFTSVPPPFKKQKTSSKRKSSNVYRGLGFLLVVLVAAMITNPSADVHRAMASNALNKKLDDVKDEINPKKKIWRILKDVTFAVSNGLLQEQIQKRISSDDYLDMFVDKSSIEES
jgi:hypothetical protein